MYRSCAAKAAYRACLLRLHPDKVEALTPPAAPRHDALPARQPAAERTAAPDPADFAAVQRAWEALKDADSRTGYDRWLAAHAAGSQVCAALWHPAAAEASNVLETCCETPSFWLVSAEEQEFKAMRLYVAGGNC